MEIGWAKIEALLRVSAVGFLVLTTCLISFDAQTKVIFYTVRRKATFRDLNALSCFISARFKGSPKWSYKNLAWISFMLDQTAVYIAFAANSAALEASDLAVTGASSFQWTKLCNKFTRFCIQIGGALLCGYLASLLMAVTSFISAFNLFRLYSPKRFLLLKGK